MSDLETKLAEARLQVSVKLTYGLFYGAVRGFDDAANIAREVVAEKDAEIARLEARVFQLETAIAKETHETLKQWRGKKSK